MPWEETEAYIRSGHREPGETCRTIEISSDLGIKAIYCKYGDEWAIQSFLFSKDKGWTLDKAKEWFEQHKTEAVRDGKVYFDLKVLSDKADPDARIFPWSMPARYYMKPGRMLIYGTALVAGKTRKGDEFPPEELRRAARSLIGGPIEVFTHSWETGENHWLPWPDNVILDAEEVDGRIEYIAGISDPKVQELIRQGELNQVSVNAICRYVPASNPGKCNGVIFSGFCLVPKDAVAASPGTCVKVWNCLACASRLEGCGEAKPPEAEVKNMVETQNQTQTDANTAAQNQQQPFDFEKFKTELLTAIEGKMVEVAKKVFLQEESEREKLHAAQQERAKKYGISPKEGGHLTKPGEYENIPEDEFADPVNYKYPIDNEEHVRGALTYFNQPAKREAGGYTTEEAARILEKIIRKALQLGITVSWQPEDPAYRALPEELKQKLEGYSQEKTETANQQPQQQSKAEPKAETGSLPVAAVKPVENVKPCVYLTEEEIVAVLSDKRRFTPALQLNGILDLLEAKRREALRQ